MFDKSVERGLIKGSFDQHRGCQSAQAERADDRIVRAAFPAFRDFRAHSVWGACVCAGHPQLDGKLVDKDQSFAGERQLWLAESGLRLGVGLRGAAGLFLRGKPQRARTLETVARQTETRSLVLIRWRSSSSVAAGCSATKSITSSTCSSVSLATAPPPCGLGAKSPVVRR